MDSQHNTKLIEELDNVKSAANCSEHAEENLEFYSFTNDKLLCAECLVSGNFVGHEVVNIKRAGEKIKAVVKKLSDQFKESLERNSTWQSLLSKNKGEFGKSLEELEGEVKTSFTELRELMDKREKEIIQDINNIKAKKEAEMGNLHEAITHHEKEIIRMKEILEKRSDERNSIDLCSFYSQKRDLILDFLTSEEEYYTPRVQNALKGNSTKEIYSLSKFHDALKEIAKHVNAIPELTETENIATSDFITSDKKLEKSFKNFMNQMASPKHARNKPRTHFDHVMSSVFNKDEVPTATSRVSSAMKDLSLKETPSPSASNTGHSTMFEKYFNQIHYIRNKRNESSSTEKSVREIIKTMPESFRTLMKKDEESLTSLSSHRKRGDDRKGYLGSLASYASPNSKAMKNLDGFHLPLSSGGLSSPSARSIIDRKNSGPSASMSLLLSSTSNKDKGILKFKKY